MKTKHEAGYNERLFSGGIRSNLHYARFRWVSKQISALGCRAESVLELGCFDGKLLEFMPCMPIRYVGYDANWEGGLDIARTKWVDDKNYSFFEATSPQDMNLKDEDIFDIAVSMETLEHVPPKMVDAYLRKIAAHLNGYFFITVPNEKGLVFLGKYATKKILGLDEEDYTVAEIVNATIGRTHLVARGEHKGFDYDKLIDEIGKYFDIVGVCGHPFEFLPASLCFGVGIVAKNK